MRLLTDLVVWIFLAENAGLLLIAWKGWKMFKSPAGSLLGAAAMTDIAMSGQRAVKDVSAGMSALQHFKAPGE